MRKLSIPELTITNTPELAYKTWWDAFIQNKFKNLWVGISVTNCEIRVEKSFNLTNDFWYSLTDASPTLTYDSIGNTERLIKDLRSSSALSCYLRSMLSSSTSNLVFNFNFNQTKDWIEPQMALLKDLNNIIQNNSIYNKERFAHITLSPTTSKMLESKRRAPT